MLIFLSVLQILVSLGLIVAIMMQTTKSESSGASGGMGWGTIGGKSSSSLNRWGLEEHLGRITTWIAVGFLFVSLLTAIAWSKA
jgi:protein translocase SecG subunit